MFRQSKSERYFTRLCDKSGDAADWLCDARCTVIGSWQVMSIQYTLTVPVTPFLEYQNKRDISDQKAITNGRPPMTGGGLPLAIARDLSNDGPYFFFGPPYFLELQHLWIECKLRRCVLIYNLSIKLNILKIGGKLLFKLRSKKVFFC